MTSKTKTLAERVAERVGKESQGARRQGRNAFLAMKDDIAGALDAGWAVKDIWKTLREEGRMVVSYQAFASYVARYLRATPVALQMSSERKPPAATTGFALNPTANKEELL
jgi:hypothetical protein